MRELRLANAGKEPNRLQTFRSNFHFHFLKGNFDMSENTNLVPSECDNLPAVSMGSDDNFDDLSKGADFLGRLQLFSKGKSVNKGLIVPGHWGIQVSDEEVTCIGKSVDVIPFARRPKAIDLSDTDAIIANYDMESDQFKEIAQKSTKKDSNCMYGPSFLVFERSTGRFLEWFCGTKSTRPEAKKMYPFLETTEEDINRRDLEGQEPHGPLPFTMNIRLVEKTYSWHVPVVVRCSTPFTSGPSRKEIIFEMQRFLNPVDSGLEKVDAEESGRNRAR